MQGNDKVDAVIVGAGAAGCMFAADLAAAGKSVVVLEAGPAWQTNDLVSSQIWARRLKWGGSPVLGEGNTSIGYTMNSGWGYGGAALHHFALWPRLHAEDFKLNSLYGKGLDWPIEYETLRPYYDFIQTEVGLSGDADAEIWRPPGDPYPMKPLASSPQSDIIAGGFTRLGFRTAPLPAAINSEWYNGRPPCVYDGWCDAGCPINALAHPLAIYKPRAETAGAAFRSGSTVTRILLDSKQRHATGVRYVATNGRRYFQPAATVILAAHAVQNARLLLNSPTHRFADGLANSSKLVGKYFMAHFAAGIFGLFREKTLPYLGLTGGHLICQDGYVKDRRKNGFGSYQWVIGPALKPNDLLGIANSRPELIGNELHDFLDRAAYHLGTMGTTAEVLPELSNRIETSARKDRYGMPLAKVIYNHSENTRLLIRHCQSEGLDIFRSAGALQSWAGAVGNVHLMGGTIMGEDPASSVTDEYGRTHDVPNLLIAGSGLFPTCGGVNPTFTIHALTRRTAERMLNHWNDFSISSRH